MGRVLILTYSFPPDPAAGAQRPWGMYRNLQTCGWEPEVITASAGFEARDVSRVLHHRAAKRVRGWLGIPPSSRGFVARALRGARRYLGEFTTNPEDESGWGQVALAAGLDRVAKGGVDVILSTSPPGTAHLVAHRLKKRTGLPWVADLRDLWAENYAYPWSALRRMVDRRSERRILRDADALVTVSEPLAQVLRYHHSRASSIPNGFAPEEAAEPGHPLSEKFTITYTGTLYPGKRRPEMLLEALAGLTARGEVNPDVLRVRFFGRNVDQPSLASAIAAHGLEHNVVLGGLLPRDEALSKQRESQILLTLDWMDPGQPGVYTGKLFEYLAAQRPILSIGPTGSVVDALLRETGAGRQCSTVSEIQDSLRTSFREFEGGGRVSYRGDPIAIQRYDHTAMARQFAKVLCRVTTGAHVATEGGSARATRGRPGPAE